MTLMLAIGIPVFLILGGALLAASVSNMEVEEPAAPTADQASDGAQSIVYFQPMGWSAQGKEVPIEEIVSNIERHLKDEHAAASVFASNPSRETLHVD